MRWAQQSLDGDPQAALTGYRDATVRHFDAPEASETRFWEVRAKSILNRVPEASQVPFRWTINPYRGCTHACSYCLGEGTPVLLADGRMKPIERLGVGDAIVGTRREGGYRRLVTTSVRDIWSTMKPAWLVSLSDGTEIVASADHRFLSSCGWKHVFGTEQGPIRRPHLTRGLELLGPGGCVPAPEQYDAYRRGYLCGMVRGDGTVGTYRYDRPGRSPGTVHRFRLALCDNEALDRTQAYLEAFSVPTVRFRFSPATSRHREAFAIRAQSAGALHSIRELVAWPADPSTAWRRGFLAGVFDAEGSCSKGILRFSNTDPEILRQTEDALRALEFDAILEPNVGRCSTVRLRGGLAERTRFMLSIDPAITRKRVIDGTAIKGHHNLTVVSVRSLGEVRRLWDITTGTGDFVAGGVVSHNCFARPTHEYLGFDAGRDFEREIVVKVNAPERLRVELARPAWVGEHVALGTNTDPYQWVEGRYRLMRGIWAALLEARNPCSVLTKSPLLLRDLDLMTALNEVTDFSAALSIPTLETKAWRATEPRSPNPRARLEAVAALSSAGIRTSVLVAPLMPGINDRPEQVAEVVRLATEAGASHVGGIALHLRRGVREVFLAWLAEHAPELTDRYGELYRAGAYATPAERARLSQLISAAQTDAVGPGASTGGRRTGGSARRDGPDRRDGPGRWGPGSPGAPRNAADTHPPKTPPTPLAPRLF